MPSYRPARLRLGRCFLALLFVFWSAELVRATCNSPPKIWIEDKTLECQYDRQEGGPDPKYAGRPKTSPAKECPHCWPDPPTYHDQVLATGVDSTSHDSSSCPYPKVIERTWYTKACNIPASVCQKITIIDTTAPVFDCEDTTFQVQCGEDYSPKTLGYPKVHDNCDQRVKLTYKDYEFPGNCPVIKAVKRVWTATDDCGNQSYFIQWIYIKDTKGPSWKWVPSDCYRDCKETCDIKDCGTPKAYDACSSDVKVYVDKEYELPNPTGCGKTIVRVWVAEDCCGQNTTHNQKIFIKDKTLPYWTHFPDNYTIDCKGDTEPSKCGYPRANDDCSGVCEVEYKDYYVQGKCSCSKTIKRVWSAKDKCGNTISKTQYIYVKDDKAPCIKNLKNITVECDKPNSCDALGGYPTVKDNCSPEKAINVTYKEWTYQGDCPAEKIIKRVWKAEDECGNDAYESQFIYVVDKTAPSWKWLPHREVIVTCSEDTDPDKCGRPTAEDNCDCNPDICYEDEEECPEEGCYLKTIKRTWKLKDCSNNKARNFIQTIKVKATPPSEVTFNAFCLWPPNHFYYAIKNLTYSGLVTATSTCKGCYSDRVYIKTAYCKSNQPDNAPGDGDFCRDCYYSPTEDTLYIRAERSGESDRIYTVGLIVVDSLNPDCKTFYKKVEGLITVPHDQTDHPECIPANTNKK